MKTRTWLLYVCFCIFASMHMEATIILKTYAGTLLPDSVLHTVTDVPPSVLHFNCTIKAQEDMEFRIAYSNDAVPNTTMPMIMQSLPRNKEYRLPNMHPLSASAVYLTIAGQHLLLSDKYYAGGPKLMPFTITTAIETCDSGVPMQGHCVKPDHTLGRNLEKVVSQTIESTKLYDFYVEEPFDSVSVAFTMSGRSVQQICKAITSSGSPPTLAYMFEVSIFKDKPDDPEEVSKRIITIARDALACKTTVNGKNASTSTSIKQMITVPYPLRGRWFASSNVRVSAQNSVDRANSTRRRIASTPTAVDLTVALLPSTCETAHKSALDPSHNLANKHTVGVSSLATINTCTHAASLSLLSDDRKEWGIFSAKSISLSSLQGSTEILPSAVSYLHLPSKDFFPVGGQMKIFIDLIPLVYANDTSSEATAAIDKMLNDANVRADIRCGAPPKTVDHHAALKLADRISQGDIIEGQSDPSASKLPESSWDTTSLNAFSGTSAHNFQSATFFSVDSSNEYFHDMKLDGAEKPHKRGIRYEWSIEEPLLPNLHTEAMYVRLTGLPGSNGSLWDAHTVKMGLRVALSPCRDNFCMHGVCSMHIGEVIVSSCHCSYPWAGEQCDTLAISEWFYTLQVLSMVLSNAAVVPGLYASLGTPADTLQFCPIVAAFISIAALSSAVYHLCDSDVVCIGDLPFSSLQDLDILFSILSIVSVLLFHCPYSTTQYAVLMIYFVGILTAPVTANPTNPATGAFAVILALLTNIVFYIVNRQYMKHFQVSQSTQTSVGDPEELNTSLPGGMLLRVFQCCLISKEMVSILILAKGHADFSRKRHRKEKDSGKGAYAAVPLHPSGGDVEDAVWEEDVELHSLPVEHVIRDKLPSPSEARQRFSSKDIESGDGSAGVGEPAHEVTRSRAGTASTSTQSPPRTRSRTSSAAATPQRLSPRSPDRSPRESNVSMKEKVSPKVTPRKSTIKSSIDDDDDHTSMEIDGDKTATASWELYETNVVCSGALSSTADDSRGPQIGIVRYVCRLAKHFCCDSAYRWMLIHHYTVTGFVMALIGITCFVTQTKDNYWYSHSLWHILLFTSVVPFVLGRRTFMEYHFSHMLGENT